MKIEYTPSFIDGAGSGALLPKMWEHARDLVTDAFAISLEDAAAGVRTLLERARIVGEGAAGLPVAAALAGLGGTGRVVCIVSGGNIDSVASRRDPRRPRPRLVDERPLEARRAHSRSSAACPTSRA